MDSGLGQLLRISFKTWFGKIYTVVGVYRGQAYRGHFAIFRKNYLGVYRGHFENDRLPDFLSLMKRRSQLIDYKTSHFSDILYFTRKNF